MRILCDLDETIAMTMQSVWSIYKLETDDYSTDYRDLDGWYFTPITPLWSKEQQDNIFINPELFKILKPYENAIEVLQKLHNEGHEIIILTVHNPLGIKYKAQWIKDNLPFINKVIYIDSNGKMDKSMIAADLIFDDNVQNLETSICKYRVCHNQKWNKEWKGDRVNSWLGFYDYVQEINRRNNKINEVELHNLKKTYLHKKY